MVAHPVRVGIGSTLSVRSGHGSRQSKKLRWAILFLIAFSSSIIRTGIGQTPPAGKRTLKDIQADLNESSKAAYATYDRGDMVEPKYRTAMAERLTVAIKRDLELAREFEKADPQHAEPSESAECLDLAMLSLYGDSDAGKQLEDYLKSSLPSRLLIGKLGVLMKDWWTKPDADVQTKVLESSRAIAKANPRSDLLPSSFLAMARYGAASDQLASELRDVVETLSSPSAVKYKARPDKVGRPLVVVGPALSGKRFSTADMKGKVVVLQFWATWCEPCMREMPAVVEFYKQNHDKGLEIIGINNDQGAASMKKYLAEHTEITWLQSFDPSASGTSHKITQRFQIPAIPMTYVIDRNGILRDIQVGLPEKMIGKCLDQPANQESSPLHSLQQSPATTGAANSPMPK